MSTNDQQHESRQAGLVPTNALATDMLLSRLAAIERQNGTLRLAVAVAIVLAVMGLGVAWASKASSDKASGEIQRLLTHGNPSFVGTVRADGFALTNGTVQIRLDDGVPSIGLWGRPNATDGANGAIQLTAKNGIASLEMTAENSGSVNSSVRIGVSRSNAHLLSVVRGSRGTCLEASADEASALTMYDSNGKVRVQLVESFEYTGLIIGDDKGKTRAEFGIMRLLGRALLRFFNADGKAVSQGGEDGFVAALPKENAR